MKVFTNPINGRHKQFNSKAVVRRLTLLTVMVSIACLAVTGVSSVYADGSAPTNPPGCYNGNCCQDMPPHVYCAWGPNQPAGTTCQGDEACCMPNGTCDDSIDGLCCDDEGGTLAGQAFCSATTVICCDGTTCNSSINEACCTSPGHAGYTCGDDTDNDNVADPCDNCPECTNDANTVAYDCNNDGDTDDPGEAIGEQCDIDGDGVGDECDNCPTISNPIQEDDDEDDRGNACDNCPNDDNFFQYDSDAKCAITGVACGPISDMYLPCAGGVPCITDTTHANGYAAYGDACDNCDDLLNGDQDDCDADGEGDDCAPYGDCDQDGLPDNCDFDLPDCDGDFNPNQCDEDDDNDGIDDDVDLCDFTPANAPIDTNPDSCFYGTLSGDLDGDCDVDADDLTIFNNQFTDQGCEDGGADFSCAACEACAVCDPCDPCKSTGF